MFFSASWICVLRYYYQIYDKRQQRPLESFAVRLSRGSIANRGEVSRTSFSMVSVEEYMTPPPAYDMVFKNPAFQLDDENVKLPSYDEVVVNESSEANKRY